MINNIETPCFILDKKELERSIAGFQSALADNFARSIVGYSVKTCSLPHAMIIARDNGCYAEVVSHDEFMLAKACGFPVDKIIYNGPLKSETTFIEAITQGSIVNIDTQREIEWLQRLPASRSYDVGLRLNINISKISPDDADGDNDNSRFGFSDDTGELSSALCDIFRNENIRIAGIHIHRTAHSRSVDFYKHSIEYACQIIDKYNLSPRYIDIGGGYFGIFPGKPTYAEYAAAFREVLKRYGKENLTVIVEPGNAIVASAFRFVSSVIDIKHTEENHYFVTTDGSRNDVDPFFRKSSYLY